MKPMYKIAVVGDKDSVLAFKALGIDVRVAYVGAQFGVFKF